MPNPLHSPITESQILTSYLLPPSPLPTIIPYSTFLSLIPTTYRNNPDHTPAIKRLYRDLQFQRDITLSQVQENIERECGTRAVTLRASLTRRIAVEEGEAEDGRKRKRRRVGRQGSEHGSEDQQDIDSDDGPDVRKEEEFSSSDDELSKPVHIQAHQAFYNDPSRGHPAAYVLQPPAEMVAKRVKLEGKSKFHTKESLLAAMENAAQSLDEENADLEAECDKLKEEIKETVGGLSDLKYGRANKKVDDEADGTGGEYKDILDALTQFRSGLKANTGSLGEDN